MARFVREIAFDAGDERRLAVRPRHRAHLRTLFERGKLVTAGPWADDRGALLIYEVADSAEMEELIAADPYTGAGVVTEVGLREWRPILPE
jgi:uncharacterized protein YciI